MKFFPSPSLSVFLHGSFFCLVPVTVILPFAILPWLPLHHLKISPFVLILKTFQNIICILPIVRYQRWAPASIAHTADFQTDTVKLYPSLSCSPGRTSAHIPIPYSYKQIIILPAAYWKLDKYEVSLAIDSSYSFTSLANLYLAIAFCFKFDWKAEVCKHV